MIVLYSSSLRWTFFKPLCGSLLCIYRGVPVSSVKFNLYSNARNSYLSPSFDPSSKISQLGYTSSLIHQVLHNETMKRLTMQCIKECLQRRCICHFSGAVCRCRQQKRENKGPNPLLGKHLMCCHCVGATCNFLNTVPHLTKEEEKWLHQRRHSGELWRSRGQFG